MKLLFLSRADVERLLTIPLAFEADREAYAAYSAGNAVLPPIVSMEFPGAGGEMDVKAGYSGLHQTIGVKTLGAFWDNPSSGLPVCMGLMTLMSGVTGQPLCVLNAGPITYYRTAAAGAYAATLLAREDSTRLAVIGTGALARMHLEATAAYFPLREVFVYSPNAAHRAAFLSDLAPRYPAIRFRDCATAASAVRDADIIATATPAASPVILDAWIRPGTHINAFGSDMPGKQELEATLLTRAKLVTDSLQECCRRGETQHPIRLGLLRPEDVYAEIGELALGQKPGRTSREEITVFDSTGMSLQDISTAARIYHQAVRQGIGVWVDM